MEDFKDTFKNLFGTNIHVLIKNAILNFAISKDEDWPIVDDDDYDDVIKTPIPKKLNIGYATLFSVLNNAEKKSIVKSTENARRAIGKTMSRTSDLYKFVFMHNIFETGFVDIYSGNLSNTFKNNFNLLSQHVPIYNWETKQELRLKKSLAIQMDQNVYLAEDTDGKTWVVKWEGKPFHDSKMTEEIYYNRIKDLGGIGPELLSGFKIFNGNVLILEFLEALDITDNPIEVGRQLISTQLKYIHVFGMHNDLKPDNIRKRPSNPPVYFIIDMDLDTIPQIKGGYMRNHWTPFYHSQPFISPSLLINTYRSDFIELGYVLNQMILARNYKLRISQLYQVGHRRYNYTFFEMGLRKNDFLSDLETMREYYFSQKEIPLRVWKVMNEMVKNPAFPASEGVHRMDNEGFLSDYWLYVTSLPEIDMPVNVHDTIAFDILKHTNVSKDYMKDTLKNLTNIDCSVCNINTMYQKCKTCWRETYICSDISCIDSHVCNYKLDIKPRTFKKSKPTCFVCNNLNIKGFCEWCDLPFCGNICFSKHEFKCTE